jgi:hypothetical protein
MLGVLALTAVAGISFPSAAVAATAATASPAPQTFGIRLVGVPPSQQGAITAFLHPGMTIRRRLQIENHESRTATFTVYPAAAHLEHGQFLTDAGAARSELTTWVRISKPRVTLRPGKSTRDLITIKVPRIATIGEHYGVIWVQQAGQGRKGKKLRVTEVTRVGMSMFLTVGKGGVPPTKFVIGTIIGHNSKNRLWLTAVVRDTGQRAVELSGSVGLTDGPGGTTAGPFRELQVVTLAPGQSAPVLFVPPRSLPEGPWLAKIKLVSGFTTETASAPVKFDNKVVAASSTTRAVEIAAAIVGLVLLGCLLAALRLRQSRRPQGLRPAHAR